MPGGSCTHTPHSLHLFATGSSDGGVLLCSVERCSTGRSSQNKPQEESGPLPHSCDLFHRTLYLLHADSNSVSGREVAAFYRTAFITPQTSCVGGRKAVSHSLAIHSQCSHAVCVASVWCSLLYIVYMFGHASIMQSPDWISTMCVI